MWLGHASGSITDLYAKGLRHHEEFRREGCERAGPAFAPEGLKGHAASVGTTTENGHVTLVPFID
jgi:hypothetical protein